MDFTRFLKPRLKFLRQMLYGIQVTKSVILNRIAAEIDENIKQVKIEMRLCRHLAFKDLWKHIHEAVMEHAKKFVRKSTLIIIDPSDVQKPYAKKMQYLGYRFAASCARGIRGRNPETLHTLREVECETRPQEGAGETFSATRIRLRGRRRIARLDIGTIKVA